MHALGEIAESGVERGEIEIGREASVTSRGGGGDARRGERGRGGESDARALAGDGGEFGDAHVATSVDEGAGGGFVHVSTGAEDGGDDVEAGFGPVAEKEAVFADKGVGVCGGDEGSEVSKPGDSTEGFVFAHANGHGLQEGVFVRLETRRRVRRDGGDVPGEDVKEEFDQVFEERLRDRTGHVRG